MVKGDKGGRRAGETNRDCRRGGEGEGRHVLTPFTKNGYIKRDFHLLGSPLLGIDPLGNSAPAPLSNHRLPCELPKHLSHRWASPGQGCQPSLWQLQTWRVGQPSLGCLLEPWA